MVSAQKRYMVWSEKERSAQKLPGVRVCAAGVREVLKAEGETEALRVWEKGGKMFREYEKQQGEAGVAIRQ